MGLPRPDMGSAKEASEILRGGDVRGIDGEDVKRWLDNWRQRGFLG